jgi:hypothetical protein
MPLRILCHSFVGPGSNKMRSISRGLPNVYLFINPNSGKPYLTDSLQRLWKDACKAAGLYAAWTALGKLPMQRFFARGCRRLKPDALCRADRV